MAIEFDESRLDDPAILADYDEQLRHLAGTGARIRIEATDVTPPGEITMQPRGVVVAGSEARLLRAVLEPVCPVPVVAWQLAGLPGWAGPLDLVVVLASNDDDRDSTALMATVTEAKRRGCLVLLAAANDSELSRVAGDKALRVPTRTRDARAAAVVVLALLHRFGLGPAVNADHAAEAADLVAEESSPHCDLSQNPAKYLACGLGDADPLIWGGGVLPARASRRIAEAIRFYSGRHALAADAGEIRQVLRHVEPRDLFADPVTDAQQRRPVLVMLDDEQYDEVDAAHVRTLRAEAERAGVRVCEVAAGGGSDVDRYVTLLLRGLYGASYLAVGLGAAPGLVE